MRMLSSALPLLIRSDDKRRTPVENEHLEGVSLESNLYEGSNHLDSQSRVRSAFSPSLPSTTTFLHSSTLVKTPKGRMASYWKEPNESDRQEKPQGERLPKEWIKDLALSQLNLSSSISLSLLDRSFYNCSLDQVIKLTAKSFRSERRREGVRKLR